MSRYLSLLCLVLLLSGCAEPLPEAKKDYAGEWRSDQMYLLIFEDGTISYERRKKGVTTTINGPIKRFEGDNFVVGFLFYTTTFVVSEPPREMDGQWQMVVDGVRLSKVSHY